MDGFPAQCEGPRGLSYPVNSAVPRVIGKASQNANCKSNREMKDGLCYLKCSDLFGDCYRSNPDAVTECMPRKGVTYAPNIDRKNPCPGGYVYDGVPTCNNNFIPRTYPKETISADCTGERDQISGSCYDKCPVGLYHLIGIPTQCVPKRGLSYPALKNMYTPETIAKQRRIEMSTK